MSAGERYGLSAHLAEPDRACRLGMCDGSGWFVVKEDDGRDRLSFHAAHEYCNSASHEGGCLGHPIWTPCFCTADRRHP